MKYSIIFTTFICSMFAVIAANGQNNIDSSTLNLTVAAGIFANGSTATQSGVIHVRNSNSAPKVKIFGVANGINLDGGYIELFNENAANTIVINGSNGDENSRISLQDSFGTSKIQLNSNYFNGGDSRLITDDLEINGGSDLAELFNISNHLSEIKAGYLVSIDPEQAGNLKISNEAYDNKLAGVISGANGIKPGIIMGQKGTLAHGDQNITLSGRAYVKANTTNGEIKVGDFLTSSDVPGEAMRATSKRKSEGAIVGKAMTALEDGSDFILVLVLNQ